MIQYCTLIYAYIPLNYEWCRVRPISVCVSFEKL